MVRQRLLDNNDGAVAAEPEHEIGQLRAEVEPASGRSPAFTKGAQQFSRRRAIDADGCMDLEHQKERQW
jgi:hypothetical protein